MRPIKLVCLISSYREGPLLQAAVNSALPHVDHVHVWEGPAGTERCPDAPPSEGPISIHGKWSTDAEKRTAMIRRVRELYHDSTLWVLWIDADEVLVNGWALRDYVRSVAWADDLNGATLATSDPEKRPTGGVPLYLVEPDGSVSIMRGRLVRGDLIRAYLVSNLIIEAIDGSQIRLGNVPQNSEAWLAPRVEQHGPNLFLLPPLPGEPFIVHRSHLRHPARAALRMHEQEADELASLQS